MRTSKTDNNYFSIAGGITSCGGVAGVPIPNPPEFLPPSPQDFDATLKVCDGTSKLTFVGLRTAQGREAAVDVNNGVSRCVFEGSFGEPDETGDQVITLKGGSHDNIFRGIMRSRGRKACIVLGTWSDENLGLSYGTNTAGLRHDDGDPIPMIVGHHRWPSAAERGPNVRILLLASLAEKAYWWLKWAAVKSGLWAWYVATFQKGKTP